jgi:ribulose-phosphate 3-epimerase
MAEETVLAQLRRMRPTLSVGLLTADLMRLDVELRELDGTGVGVLHFDVMDGVFCPMMTVGPPFVKGVKSSLLKDAHLMVRDPLPHLRAFVDAGADIVTVHVECGPHVHRALQFLGSLENARGAGRGIVRGAALNPGTPLETLDPLLDDLEMVTLLAINPGWGGQSLIASTRRRVAGLREIIERSDRDILIAVDGGVTRANIAEIGTWGVDLVVTGSAVFDGKTPRENARFMLASLRGDGFGE